MSVRSCGSCTECCTVLSIPSLEKSRLTPCSHLKRKKKRKKGGCGIYGKRPEECRTFQCAWTSAEIPKQMRPDKTGLMAYWVESQFGLALLITETRQAAFDRSSQELESIIDIAHSQGRAVLLATHDGRGSAVLPDDLGSKYEK